MTRPDLAPATLLRMDREGERRGGTADGGSRLLLAGQLRLLEAKREQIRTLRERDGGDYSFREAFANDLVGIRLVLSAALLSQGLDEAERDELERREREARELLGEVTNVRVVRARHEDHP